LKHTPSAGPQGPDAYPSLKGRSIIVTGAGQGIGRCLSLALAERGANVLAIASRDLESLRMTVRISQGLSGHISTLQADICSIEDCNKVVALAVNKFGGLDALINNAARGIAYVREPSGGVAVPFWEADKKRWAETMTTNVIGTYYMSAVAMSYMKSREFGRIINISTSDRSMIREMNSPYGPSKAALEAMSVAWSKEAATFGVTVNVLLPGGATKTRMITGVSTRTPLEPDIMNPAILWLCSDNSAGYSGGRYIAADWNTEMDPEEAANAAQQVAHELPVIM